MVWIVFRQKSKSLPGFVVVHVEYIRKTRLGPLHKSRIAQVLGRQPGCQQEDQKRKKKS